MTATITAPPLDRSTPVDRPGRTERLVAGWAALGFVAIVGATNLVVGSTPAFDAPAEEIVTFVADKHDQLAFSTAPYGVAMLLIVAFGCAIRGRLQSACRPDDQVWARIGVVGVLLLAPSFAAVMVQRMVLTVGSDERIGSPDLAALVWRMEAAAFLLNVAVIGIAHIGLGTAASRSGLLPSWFRFVSWTAGAACIVTACAAVAGLEGAPLLPLGLYGFLSWMLLLVMIGVRQLRAAD